jgi:hypothetical protein
VCITNLLSRLEFHLEELVSALLKVQAGLNGEVDGASQVNHVGLCLVDDVLLWLI